MNNISSELFKYGFHDTFISSIEIRDGKAFVQFPSGLYYLDESGKETELTGKCTMIIKTIDGVDIYNQIEILCLLRRKKYKEIDSENIESIIAKTGVGVMNLYYSRFCSSIMFICGNSKGVYCIDFEACTEVKFLF